MIYQLAKISIYENSTELVALRYFKSANHLMDLKH